MKHKSTVYIGLGVVLFILAILLFPSMLDNSNSTIEKLEAGDGVYYSYYGTIFGGLVGGLVGGMFTYLGVKMSLDDRKYLEKKKSKKNRDMLLVQLQHSYTQLGNYPDSDVGMNGQQIVFCMIPKLIIDDNWNEYLLNFEGLSQGDNIAIRTWIEGLQELDKKRASKSGITHIDLELFTPKQLADRIKSIIDKLESQKL